RRSSRSSPWVTSGTRLSGSGLAFCPPERVTAILQTQDRYRSTSITTDRGKTLKRVRPPESEKGPAVFILKLKTRLRGFLWTGVVVVVGRSGGLDVSRGRRDGGRAGAQLVGQKIVKPLHDQCIGLVDALLNRAVRSKHPQAAEDVPC